MDKSDKTILVTGATGQQGGATARHLLAQGWRVRVLARDPSKPAAQALAQAGAEVVRGDNEDRASLDAALQGVYGVFSVQSFAQKGVGPEGEIRQGKTLADAAKAAGVQHFVYSSAGGAERNTGVPQWESKWQIEQHIRALNLPHTILRPVSFMENYNWVRPLIRNGIFLKSGMRPDKTWQLIAVDDIGAFAALAFGQPDKFIGKAIEIAGDELTEKEIAAVFSRVIGKQVTLGGLLGNLLMAIFNTIQRGQDKVTTFLNEGGYVADIPALRKLYPPLKTLETWLRQTGWENAQPVPEAQNAPSSR